MDTQIAAALIIAVASLVTGLLSYLKDPKHPIVASSLAFFGFLVIVGISVTSFSVPNQKIDGINSLQKPELIVSNNTNDAKALDVNHSLTSCRVWTNKEAYGVREAIDLYVNCDMKCIGIVSIYFNNETTTKFAPRLMIPGKTYEWELEANYPIGKRTILLEAFCSLDGNYTKPDVICNNSYLVYGIPCNIGEPEQYEILLNCGLTRDEIKELDERSRNVKAIKLKAEALGLEEYTLTTDDKELSISQIETRVGVQDAAINQDGKNLTLTLVVDYGTSEARAEELGDSFVRLVKGTGLEECPGKEIGPGIYDYLVGVYYPNGDLVAMGAKVSGARSLTW